MTTGYEELQDAWKREFHNNELQQLKAGFFKELASYVKKLRESEKNLDSKSLKAVLIGDELQRFGHLLTQLVDKRRDKLWSLQSQGQSAILETPEQQVYQEISGIVRQHEKLKEDLLQGREPSKPRFQSRRPMMIRLVKDIPSIIGVDLKTHGPFLKEDIARLPPENAESLIRQGAAVEIGPTSQDNE